jgi:hypothetical protein
LQGKEIFTVSNDWKFSLPQFPTIGSLRFILSALARRAGINDSLRAAIRAAIGSNKLEERRNCDEKILDGTCDGIGCGGFRERAGARDHAEGGEGR